MRADPIVRPPGGCVLAPALGGSRRYRCPPRGASPEPRIDPAPGDGMRSRHGTLIGHSRSEDTARSGGANF